MRVSIKDWFPLVEEWPRGHYMRKFVCELRGNPTSAEKKFKCILGELASGNKFYFAFQCVVLGKWIADFFVPEIGLVIEVDGPVHSESFQRKRDEERALKFLRYGITSVRITNDEVFGNREILKEKLRMGWRDALHRNKLYYERVKF